MELCLKYTVAHNVAVNSNISSSPNLTGAISDSLSNKANALRITKLTIVQIIP